jgi:hypothetical protein
MAVFLDIPPLAQDTNFVGGVLSHRCLDEVENKRSKGDGQDGAQLGISNADGMPADAASHLNQYNADPARATFGSYGAAWQTPSDVMHSPRTGTEMYDPSILPFFHSSIPPFLPSSFPPFLPSSLPPFLPSSLPGHVCGAASGG